MCAAERVWRKLIGDDAVRFNAHVLSTLVDCLARAGRLCDAFERIAQFEKFHRQRDADAFDAENENNRHLMWTALLAGCAKHHNALLAKHVHDEFAKRFDVNVVESAPLLLKNVYEAQAQMEAA